METVKDFIFHSGATETGNGALLYVNRNNTVTIETYGTATTSDLKFEALMPSGAYYAIAGIKLSDFAISTSSTLNTLGEVWQFDTAGIIALRIRIHAIGGGSVSVMGKVVNSNG